MTALGINCTTQDVVHGWESITPPARTDQDKRKIAARDRMEQAWSRYLVICEELEAIDHLPGAEFRISQAFLAAQRAQDAYENETPPAPGEIVREGVEPPSNFSITEGDLQ